MIETHEDLDLARAPIGAGEPRNPPPPDVLPSEAIVGFAAWLTTRAAAVTLGAAHESAQACELAKAYCESQGFEVPREDFDKHLRPPPPEVTVSEEPTADQAAVLRLSETCRLVMAEDADLWTLTGFTNPTGQHGITSCRLFFTGIDDDGRLHFALPTVCDGVELEIQTDGRPEDLPMPLWARADAQAGLVQNIRDRAATVAAIDARMRETGQPVA